MIYVDRTNDEIKDSPEFNESAYGDESYRSDLGDYYPNQADVTDSKSTRWGAPPASGAPFAWQLVLLAPLIDIRTLKCASGWGDHVGPALVRRAHLHPAVGLRLAAKRIRAGNIEFHDAAVGGDKMALKIDGALYREVTGPAAAPLMVFVHPNPMDNAAWMYQLAHLSTWYRCVAVDLPGYGRSPRARPGVTLFDLAEACWDAAEPEGKDPAVLVGCSVGTNVVLHMQHLSPERTAAVVVSGAGYATEKPHLQRHVDAYRRDGVEYRNAYALQDFSPAFRATPLAEWMAGLWTERNDVADVPSILAMFDALIQGDPPWFADVQVPVLILTGSEDAAHQRAFALRDVLPDAELVTLVGAGHACQLEQPWEFDRHLLDFLDRRLGLPGIARPGQHARH